MQLEQVCAAMWKGHGMGLRNRQGTTKMFVFFFFGKDTNSFVTKETIGKGESLQVMAERRKGLGWAGMQSVPLTGNGTIGKNPDLFLFFLQIDFWFILHWGKQTNKQTYFNIFKLLWGENNGDWYLSLIYFLTVTCFWDRCLKACVCRHLAHSWLRHREAGWEVGLRKWDLSGIPFIHLLWSDVPGTQTSCKWQPRLITQTTPGTQASLF